MILAGTLKLGQLQRIGKIVMSVRSLPPFRPGRPKYILEGKGVVIMLPTNMYDTIRQFCDREGYTLNEFIVWSLSDVISGKKTKT